MKTLSESKLYDGIIFGDKQNNEYVYMPASEIGMEHPKLIFESSTGKEDISMEEGLTIIRLRSLRPTTHPVLGSLSI